MASYEFSLANNLLESGIAVTAIDSVVLSSMVPTLTGIFSELARRMFSRDPLIVGPDIYFQLKIEINDPQEIGTDLVANAGAAFDKLGQDCIVVDFGTALTFTTLSGEGKILGVAIRPRIKNSLEIPFRRNGKITGGTFTGTRIRAGTRHHSGDAGGHSTRLFRIGTFFD